MHIYTFQGFVFQVQSSKAAVLGGRRRNLIQLALVPLQQAVIAEDLLDPFGECVCIFRVEKHVSSLLHLNHIGGLTVYGMNSNSREHSGAGCR
jgi:hypothetical protein